MAIRTVQFSFQMPRACCTGKVDISGFHVHLNLEKQLDLGINNHSALRDGANPPR